MRIIEANCVFGRWPGEARDVSAERLLKILADLGIERGLAVSLRGVFYDHDEGNAETLEVSAAHDALLPAATITPRRYADKESLPGKLKEQGFRILRLFPHIQEWTLESVVVERVFAECAEAGLPLAFPIRKKPDLASGVARLAPPGCRVILSDVYYNPMVECVEVMRRREEFLMEMGHTCVPGSVEFLCKELGASRLVLGTGQPLESGRGAIEAVKRARISDEDKAAILGDTLAGLLEGGES